MTLTVSFQESPSFRSSGIGFFSPLGRLGTACNKVIKETPETLSRDCKGISELQGVHEKRYFYQAVVVGKSTFFRGHPVVKLHKSIIFQFGKKMGLTNISKAHKQRIIRKWENISTIQILDIFC